MADADEAPTAALAMRMSAEDQRALGVVDEVIAEPPERRPPDPAETGSRLSRRSCGAGPAETIPLDVLVEQRYRRYRSLGAFEEVAAPAPTPPCRRAGPRRAAAQPDRAGSRGIPAPLPVGRRQEPPAREDV